MNILESVRIALRALAANKLRATLTMLGIIIGVGAVIALMSLGQGVQDSVEQQIQGVGPTSSSSPPAPLAASGTGSSR